MHLQHIDALGSFISKQQVFFIKNFYVLTKKLINWLPVSVTIGYLFDIMKGRPTLNTEIHTRLKQPVCRHWARLPDKG